MARWITFDQETSSLLRSTLAQGATIEMLRRGAVDYALAKPSPVVALVPAIGGSDVGIAVFRPAQPVTQTVTAPSNAMPATRVGGFLGLSDELVFEPEAHEKKGWWKRFWETD